MKAPSEARPLRQHRPQALRLLAQRGRPGDGTSRRRVRRALRVPALRDLGAGRSIPNAPRSELDLIDLPDQYDALLFLAGREPVFAGGQAQLTRDAVAHLVDALPVALGERRAAEPGRAARLPPPVRLVPVRRGPRTDSRASLHAHRRRPASTIPRRSSADDLGQLFDVAQHPGGDARARPLRRHPVRQRRAVRDSPPASTSTARSSSASALAAQFDWKQGRSRPSSARCSRARSDTTSSGGSAPTTPTRPTSRRSSSRRSSSRGASASSNLERTREAAARSERPPRLRRARSGVRLRQLPLRRLPRAAPPRAASCKEREQRASSRGAACPSSQTPRLSSRSPTSRESRSSAFAVALARVTLWMGHKLAVDELELAESDAAARRPLGHPGRRRAPDRRGRAPTRSSATRRFTATRTSAGIARRRLRRVARSATFGVGVKDLLRLLVPEGTRPSRTRQASRSRRHELDRQNRARGRRASTTSSTTAGVITNAVSSQAWPGEANVHVSIVNWVKEPAQPPSSVLLDGREVPPLPPRSDPGVGEDRGTPLEANRGRQFFGVVQSGDGFILEDDEAPHTPAYPAADYSQVSPAASSSATTSPEAPRPSQPGGSSTSARCPSKPRCGSHSRSTSFEP